MRETKVIASGILCTLLLAMMAAPMALADDNPSAWPFFAFDNGVGRGAWQAAQQAEVLADLGYQGIGYTGVKNIPEMLKALRARDLKMFSTYIQVNIQEDVAPYDAGLPEAIRQLKGEGTALWIHVHGKVPQSEAQDRRAVKLIRTVADRALNAELPVVLYPHAGFYVATTEDAVRLAKLVDRKNVGASFNLCHFLKQNDPRTLEKQLKAAMPYLMLVSINGADSGETKKLGWDRLIQTLDQGSIDVKRVLDELQRGGYEGPIGLQCYAIKGDIRENLAKSISAWNELTK
jgi:sugar phosphate isomerase/epimerase